MATIIYTLSFIIFISLVIFTLFIAPWISEKVQLAMVCPTVICGILFLILPFIICFITE